MQWSAAQEALRGGGSSVPVLAGREVDDMAWERIRQLKSGEHRRQGTWDAAEDSSGHSNANSPFCGLQPTCHPLPDILQNGRVEKKQVGEDQHSDRRGVKILTLDEHAKTVDGPRRA